MHWQSDCDYEDVGIDGDGIMSFWDCPNCSTSIEIYMTENSNEQVQE